MNKQGFTLLELLIVIGVIGLLSAALFPNILRARAQALDTSAFAYGRKCITTATDYALNNPAVDMSNLTCESLGLEAPPSFITSAAVSPTSDSVIITYAINGNSTGHTIQVFL